MKKIISLLLFVFTGILMADQIDIAVSEGTDQRVVETLIPQPAEVEADANVTIKAIFSKALNPMTVRRSITLKKLNKEKQKSFFGFFKGKRDERVSGKVSYDANSYTVSFKPDNPLEVGFYEVSFRHLMTRNPGRDMRIKPITYRFYVPEVINGFKLPPEPDEDKNNETLLGIDFNRNGIRDDAERTIIKKYNDKIKVNLMFQYARIDQKILGSELTKEKALELEAEGGKAINCKMYLKHQEVYLKRGARESEELTYNIKKRAKKYIEYNRLLGGGVYGSKVSDWNADACEFDVESMLEERQ
jgi:hypothetical protein